MKKKAIAPEFIVILIIALISTGMLLKLTQKISDNASKSYDPKMCKQSVILNSQGRLPVVNGQEFNLDCPTRYTTFYKDKAVTESRKSKFEEKITCGSVSSQTDQQCYLNEANRIISKMMFECWDQFAAGQLQVLDAWNPNRQCVLCSRFKFDSAVQGAFKESVGNKEIGMTYFKNQDPKKDFTLDNYMRSHNPQLHKISYYEFVMDPLDVFRYPYYDYNLNEPYAIIFKAMNKDQVKKIADEAWNIITLKHLFSEAKEGDQETAYVNVMQLVKYDEVSKECDTLE